jgi:short-subunit dehydrogenase
VWITGASSGIGRAVAHACAARGDRLVLSSRAEEVLDEVRAECDAAGATAVLVRPLDVADADAVQAAADEAVARFGRLDVVVQCAGVVAYGRLEEVPLDVFDRVITTNVLGATRVCRAAVRVFRAQRSGSLVIVGSLLGKVAVPYMGSYIISKFAVRALGRVLQQENRDLRHVNISLVSPGGVDTPIYDQSATIMGRRNHPPFPVSSPQHVAAKVLRAIERPHRELDVGWGNPFMRAAYSLTPSLFDAIVGPVLKLASFTPRRRPNGPGNVLEPQPGGERLRQDRGRVR